MLGVISTNTLYELHHVKFLPAVANAHFARYMDMHFYLCMLSVGITKCK